MSKIAFFVFSADDSKKSVAVWEKYFSASERSYLTHLENTMDLLVPGLPSARCQPLKIQHFSIFAEPYFFREP